MTGISSFFQKTGTSVSTAGEPFQHERPSLKKTETTSSNGDKRKREKKNSKISEKSPSTTPRKKQKGESSSEFQISNETLHQDTKPNLNVSDDDSHVLESTALNKKSKTKRLRKVMSTSDVDDSQEPSTEILASDESSPSNSLRKLKKKNRKTKKQESEDEEVSCSSKTSFPTAQQPQIKQRDLSRWLSHSSEAQPKRDYAINKNSNNTERVQVSCDEFFSRVISKDAMKQTDHTSSTRHELNDPRNDFNKNAPSVDWQGSVMLTTKKADPIKPSIYFAKNEKTDTEQTHEVIKKSEKIESHVVSPKNLKPSSSNSSEVSKNLSPKRENKKPQNNHIKEDIDMNSDDIIRNKKFVLTGVFEQIGSREEVEELIKSKGGKVMSAVSGQTDFLVTGTRLEDGREIIEGGKYRNALRLQEKNPSKPKIIIEADFALMLNKTNEVSFDVTTSIKNEDVKTKEYLSNENKSLIRTDESKDTRPWTEITRPRNSSELIGNASVIKELCTWLNKWRLHNCDDSEPLPDNRAVLISGPPGVGKTTAARVIARETGFLDVMEFNASDDRNKDFIDSLSYLILGGETVNFSLDDNGLPRSNISKCVKRKNTCIILDELDGMSSGDRGGSAAINKIISKARLPIICICNDRMSPKVKSLAFKCLDLRFHRPVKSTLAKAVTQKAAKMGYSIEPNSVEELCESVGNDLRQIWNTLQVMYLGKEKKGISYSDMKYQINNAGVKDQQVMITPFDITTKLLNSQQTKKLKMRARNDYFFVDYDLMPLLMQENYINALNNGFQKNDQSQKMHKMLVLRQCADDFAFMDIISNNLRRNNNWSLLPNVSIFACALPSSRCLTASTFLPRSDFPRFFGKNATFGKNKRLLSECESLFMRHSTCTTRDMRCSGYLDSIYCRCLQPIIFARKNNNEEMLNNAMRDAINLLDSYSLRKEVLLETLPSFRLNHQAKLYETLDAKTKGLFTRTYNKLSKVAATAAMKPSKATQLLGSQSTAPLHREDVEDEEAALLNNEEEADNDADEDSVDKNEKISKRIRPTSSTSGKRTPKSKR